MAENEILDVGNSWHYRKWRNALSNPTLSPDQKAVLLRNEFLELTKKRLRGEPLFKILQACKQNPAALKAVIASCKYRDLAVLVEEAVMRVGSGNTIALGAYIANRMLDNVYDRARYFALVNSDNQSEVWHENFAKTNTATLRECRAELTTLLSASLSDQKLPVLYRNPRKRVSVREHVERSLLKPAPPPSGNTSSV